MSGALRAAIDAAAKAALAIAGTALVGMAGVQAWQVFARYVLNASPSWTEPVALLLMSTTMMFGAAVGVHREAHFGFFLLLETASPTMRRVLLVYSRAVAVAIGLLLAIWGGQMLLDSWSVRMAGAPLPQGMVFLPLCLGGALIAVFALHKILTAEDDPRRRAELAEAEQTEPTGSPPRARESTSAAASPDSPPSRG